MTGRIRYCVVRYYFGCVSKPTEVLARDLTMMQARRKLAELRMADPTHHDGICFYRIDREVQL